MPQINLLLLFCANHSEVIVNFLLDYSLNLFLLILIVIIIEEVVHLSIIETIGLAI